MIKLQGRSKIITNDERLPLVRSSDIVWKDGYPVVNTENALEIVCNVQPIDGKELLLVPEGDRMKENFWIWAWNFCNTAAMQINDIVIRNNIRYQCQQAQDWGSYTLSRVVRVDVGPDRNPQPQAVN